MIKLKQRPEIPAILTSIKVADYVKSLKDRVDAGEALDFDSSYWRDDKVRNALFTMHSGKCCYCERKRDEKRDTDVEHFRPKAGVTEDPGHTGYWWLAYSWENYFNSCKKCNQEHKKNQFPLMDGSQRAGTPDADLARERPFLINPEKENPEVYIAYDWTTTPSVFVKALGRDEGLRGYTTIRLLGLNHGTLPEQRAELVDILQELVETMHAAKKRGPEREVANTAKLIRKETLAEREFAGFRRAFFRSAGLGDYVAND